MGGYMEQIKELLPFNILEKDLLEQYLNERLRQGKYLADIQIVNQELDEEPIDKEIIIQGGECGAKVNRRQRKYFASDSDLSSDESRGSTVN